MNWWHSLTDWLAAYGTIVWWLSIGSLMALLAAPVVVVWLITRLPTDYFCAPTHSALESFANFPLLRLTLLSAKTLLGVVLLLAGTVMLITPGQGLLTITAGLIVAEFPGKRRLERWLATSRPVWRSLNWIRRHAGKSEFVLPDKSDEK
jgi:hypothetical protein